MGYGLAGQDSTLADTGAAFDSLDPPSAFRARKLPDGRVLVEDVPVFAETDARYTPDGKLYAPPIGLPWLKGAFKAFERKPGYWAPLHGDHHSGGVLEGVKDRERFGEFRARSVRPMRVDGEIKWVFTADYLFDDEEKAKKSNRFPYQSVEIVNEKPDEINSVALLSDKAPFVRFPNRRVDFDASGRRICYATEKGSLLVSQNLLSFAPAMAPEEDFGSPDQARAEDGKWGEGGGSGDAPRGEVTKFPGTSKQSKAEKKAALHEKLGIKPENIEKIKAERERMASEEISENKTPRAQKLNAMKKTLGDTQNSSAAYAPESEDPMADDKKPEDDKPVEAAAAPPAAAPAAEAPKTDYESRFAALEKGQEEMKAMVAKLCSSMGQEAKATDGGSIDEERKEAPAEMSAEDEKKRANAPVVAAQVQLAAEVDTLKARLESMERQKKHDELFASYSAQLADFGLTTGVKQRLEGFLASDLKYGTEFAAQYVKDVQARGQRVSRPATERGPSAPEQATGDLPAELRAYAAQGPNELATARSILVEFQTLASHGLTGDMTLAAFAKTKSADTAPRGN